MEREVQGRVGIISRGIQGSCYRLCFSKMKPRLKHEATKELRQISTSNSICLHRFVSGFDSCWTYRLHASHDYRKIFKKFVIFGFQKNPGCYTMSGNKFATALRRPCNKHQSTNSYGYVNEGQAYNKQILVPFVGLI